MAITHFICDNRHIVSCHYASSQAGLSFCRLAFVLLGRTLTLNKGLYFNSFSF